MDDVLHPAVAEYLRTFDRAAGRLSSDRRAQLREELAAHLSDAVPPGSSAATAAVTIAEFGSPTEIVGQEANEGGRAPRAPRHTILIYGFAALVVVVLIVGGIVWHFAPNGEPASIVNRHSAGAVRITTGVAYFEYDAAVVANPYPLPSGAAYPIGVPNTLLSEGYGNSGDTVGGGGAVVAHATWLCAWESEYLTAFSARDAERTTVAERMIEKWTRPAPLLNTEDDVVSWTSAVVDPMKKGNPSGVRADRVASCRAASITVPSSAVNG